MNRVRILAIGLGVCSLVGGITAMAATTVQNFAQAKTSSSAPAMPLESVFRPSHLPLVSNDFDARYVRKVNLSCGIPPLPPLGCKVGDCVCDQSGQNCQWTFVCN